MKNTLATYMKPGRTVPFFGQKTVGMTLAILVFATFLAGCGQEQFIGARPSDDGKVITVGEALQHANLGRVLTVRGSVVEICQEEGCWMVITDGTSKLRMTFKDEAFVVPMNLTGNVIVEGIVNEDIYDIESAQTIATTIGYSDSVIAAMTGDQRLPIMNTSGVLVLDKQ